MATTFLPIGSFPPIMKYKKVASFDFTSHKQANMLTQHYKLQKELKHQGYPSIIPIYPYST